MHFQHKANTEGIHVFLPAPCTTQATPVGIHCFLNTKQKLWVRIAFLHPATCTSQTYTVEYTFPSQHEALH